MAKITKKQSPAITFMLVIFGLIDLALIMRWLLKNTDVALLNPRGFIADEQFRLMMFAVIILLGVAIPTIFCLYFIAWKYRETNDKAVHYPDVRHSKLLVFRIWIIPCTTILVLGGVMWPSTHLLSPQKTIANGTKPLNIEVVAMRWKWLFIYPEQHIATVNFVQIPVNTPVQFDLSADEAPMSSFWIPHLGGQLYAMTGHVNRLNLIADKLGSYHGSSAEINGDGFAGMKFTVHASSTTDFNNWVEGVRQSPTTLDDNAYAGLLKPSQNNPTTYFGSTDTSLYAKMLKKYTGSNNEHAGHE